MPLFNWQNHPDSIWERFVCSAHLTWQYGHCPNQDKTILVTLFVVGSPIEYGFPYAFIGKKSWFNSTFCANFLFVDILYHKVHSVFTWSNTISISYSLVIADTDYWKKLYMLNIFKEIAPIRSHYAQNEYNRQTIRSSSFTGQIHLPLKCSLGLMCCTFIDIHFIFIGTLDLNYICT